MKADALAQAIWTMLNSNYWLPDEPKDECIAAIRAAIAYHCCGARLDNKRLGDVFDCYADMYMEGGVLSFDGFKNAVRVLAEPTQESEGE